MSVAGVFFRFRLCRRWALYSLGRWCSAGVQVKRGGRRSVEEGGFAVMARGDQRYDPGSRKRRGCCRWRRSVTPIHLLWSHGAGMRLVMQGRRIDAWSLAAKGHGGSISMVPVVRPLPDHHHGMYKMLDFVKVFLLVFICL
ncbi:unnamed protein product [Cuscuta epithymum]|uniref:Uncharacterized protein n=1 Tax=Cuscuta epithymum TaxID=186058 RepID=A0AAV0FDL2_9ASTE|nr:unnamed protein product [Cuscuta epithymum]